MDIRTYRDTAGAWRWTLHDARGRALEQGEAHATRAQAATAGRERLAEIRSQRARRSARTRKAAGRGRR